MCVILLTATPDALSGASVSGMTMPPGVLSGWRRYDATGTIKITAPLTDVRWENSKVYVTHEGERKEIFLAPIARMARLGLEQDALAVGKIVTIEAYPSMENADELYAERITVDGKVIELM